MNNKFTAVVTADFHLRSIDRYGKVLPSGINSRLQDRLNNISKSVDYALDKEVDFWICLGDVFDKINPPEFLRQQFVKIIAPLIKNKIHIIILIGNHDTDFKIHSFMTESDLLNVLESKAITVVSKPTEVSLKGVECLFLPWGTDEDISEQLNKYKDKIVFGHLAVNGALLGVNEYALSPGVGQKLFERHRFAYLGHYHKSQNTKKWMYVGSIAKTSFDERNDKKGFVHLETFDTKIKFKFIDVKDRIFFQHTISQEEDPQFKVLETWQNLKDKVLKLIFVGEEDWFLRFNMNEVRSKILNTGKAHKLFIEHQTKYESRIRVPEIDASSSWYNGVEVYCKRQKRPDMVDLGKSILGEVL